MSANSHWRLQSNCDHTFLSDVNKWRFFKSAEVRLTCECSIVDLFLFLFFCFTARALPECDFFYFSFASTFLFFHARRLSSLLSLAYFLFTSCLVTGAGHSSHGLLRVTFPRGQQPPLFLSFTFLASRPTPRAWRS